MVERPSIAVRNLMAAIRSLGDIPVARITLSSTMSPGRHVLLRARARVQGYQSPSITVFQDTTSPGRFGAGLLANWVPSRLGPRVGVQLSLGRV
jgi:hypothetical protein